MVYGTVSRRHTTVTDADVATYEVCGIPITALPSARAARHIVGLANRGGSVEVHLCNAYTLSLVDRDARLLAALTRAQLNLPDSAPIAWLGRRAGTAGPVRGADLVRDVVRIGVESGVRHYLYGGAPGVADEMAASLHEQAAGVAIVGVETPPYHDLSDVELHDLAARVRVSEASVVWIGIGTPRQDYLVPRLAALVDAVIVPVGAAFDFIAGRVQEAPAVLHGSGLEWLYRLSREPGRLWSRYLLGNPRFVASAVRHARREA